MSDPLRDLPISLLSKLGSVVVHVEELFSPDGRVIDKQALLSVISDPELQDWIKDMRELCLLPLKRR